MPAIRPGLLDIFNAVVGLIGKVDIVIGNTKGAAIETSPGAIQLDTDNTYNIVRDGTFGNHALELLLQALSTQVATGFSALNAAVGTPQQAGHAVTLPPAPIGYGFPGLGSSDAATIWNYQFPPGSGLIMGDLLVDAGTAAEGIGTATALPSGLARYVSIHFPWSDETISPVETPAPQVDPLTILGTDATIIDWLNRTVTGYTWSINNSQIVSFDNIAGSDSWWVCNITDLEFAQYKALLGFAPRTEAPVWPGLSKVTLGTSHALSTGLTITAPMDGAIVAITAVPPGTGSYDFNGTLSYTFVGALSFVSDNGDQEFPQGLGFQSAVYSPKEMVRASGVKVRTKPGVVGTITPWTIT